MCAFLNIVVLCVDFEKYENIPQEWEPPTPQVENIIFLLLIRMVRQEHKASCLDPDLGRSRKAKMILKKRTKKIKKCLYIRRHL